jgi:small-conductance mechanosensitive channel
MGDMSLAKASMTFGEWFRQNGIPMLAIVLVAVIVTVIARMLVTRFRRKLEGSPSVTLEINLQRATTLTNALSATAIVVIWSIAFLMVLGQLDLSIAPLLASAGVAGLALGFGAQSLVRDALAGFFILLENQFGVGDIVETQTTGGKVAGKVESLTLRITTLRAFDGTLHIVPNGNMMVVSNKSRGWARAIVDVRVPYGEDVDKVRGILEELFDEVRDRSPLKDWLRDGPSVLGIESLSDYALVVRVIADTRPSKRQDAERQLREAIQARLGERGIRVPTPPPMPARSGEGTTPGP